MIESALAGQLARFRFGCAGEVRAHGEARAVVLGAEAIEVEVEGEGGGGEEEEGERKETARVERMSKTLGTKRIFSSSAASPYGSNVRTADCHLSPPSLGKDVALNSYLGLGIRPSNKGEFAHLIRIDNDTWEGDRLTFAASTLGQHAHGFIDVYEGCGSK